MGAGHGHALYVHRSSAVHRLPPQCKVVAAVLFVLAVVATPREAVWAFALHLGALLAVAVVARVPVALALRRLALAVPFVAFALLLPFVARGDRVDVAGIGLAVEGLWGAWNVVAKATIGMLTSVVLGASTDLPDLLRGLERLRVPRVFTATAGFMVRYLDVVAGELARSRIARISRGDDPRWLWQARGVARSAGTLFVRSYERGERVHLAMLSRGYTGHLPAGAGHAAPAGPWAAALALPLAGAVVALAAPAARAA